jgi:hypothetical protein
MNFLISLRIILFFMFLGFFTASFLIGTLTILDEAESLIIFDEFNQTITDVDFLDLFLNNLTVELPMFIPGVGPAWGLYSGWSTGVSFSAIISMSPNLTDFQPLDIFYASSFGFLELIAYSIGMSRGAFLVFAFIQKSPKKSLIVWSLIEILAAILLLVIGGLIESSMLESGSLTIDDL